MTVFQKILSQRVQEAAGKNIVRKSLSGFMKKSGGVYLALGIVAIPLALASPVVFWAVAKPILLLLTPVCAVSAGIMAVQQKKMKVQAQQTVTADITAGKLSCALKAKASPMEVKQMRRAYHDLAENINATTKLLKGCMPTAKTPEVARAIQDLNELKEDITQVKRGQEKQYAAIQKMKPDQLATAFAANADLSVADHAPVFTARLTAIKNSYRPYGSERLS